MGAFVQINIPCHVRLKLIRRFCELCLFRLPQHIDAFTNRHAHIQILQGLWTPYRLPRLDVTNPSEPWFPDHGEMTLMIMKQEDGELIYKKTRFIRSLLTLLFRLYHHEPVIFLFTSYGTWISSQFGKYRALYSVVIPH